MKGKVKVSDYIVDFFLNKKSNHYFLVPGGGNMHLINSVKKTKKVSYTSFFHEQSACIAAESYSRIKNKVGICLVTSGPGSTNALTGLVGAWIESIPLIIISGQVKTKDLTKKKNKVRQTGPQEVDVVSMIKKVTKYSKTIKKVGNLINELEQAYHQATNGRQGPIWLDVPLDIQAKELNLNKIKKKPKNHKVKKFSNDKLHLISSNLNKSKKPLIYIGHGTRLAGGNKIFEKIIKKFQIPFVTTWNSLDMMPISNPLNFGSPGVVARRFSNFIIQNCDLIICIGASINEINTAFNIKNFAPLSKKIIIDIDSNELERIKLKNALKINLDAKIFLNKFYKLKFNPKNIQSWKNYCSELKKKYLNENFSKFSKTLDHYNFTKTMSEIIPKNYIICTGSSGLAIEIFYTHFQNKKNQRMFLTSGLGSMGYGLPSSIGSCVANNFKKNICLIESDGSLMFNLQELATIASYNLPIKIFILNNKGYASIRNTQSNFFKKSYVGTGLEDNIKFPNLNDLCKSFQIKYYKIKTIGDLKKTKKYFQSSKPILFDISLKKDEDLLPKVKTYLTKNNVLKSMPLEDLTPFINIEELQKNLNFPAKKISYKARDEIKKK